MEFKHPDKSEKKGLTKLSTIYFIVGILVNTGFNIKDTIEMKIMNTGYQMQGFTTAGFTFLTIVIFGAIFLGFRKTAVDKDAVTAFWLVTAAIIGTSYILSYGFDFIVDKIMQK